MLKRDTGITERRDQTRVRAYLWVRRCTTGLSHGMNDSKQTTGLPLESSLLITRGVFLPSIARVGYRGDCVCFPELSRKRKTALAVVRTPSVDLAL